METSDAGIYPAGDDSNRRPRCGCWNAWRAALIWGSGDEAETLEGWPEARKAFERWHAQATPRHEGVDGVHPREAREKA